MSDSEENENTTWNENILNARNPSAKRSVESSESSGEEEVSSEPKKKISFGLNKSRPKLASYQVGSSSSKRKPAASISIKLNAPQKVATEKTKLKPKIGTTALAFNENEDDDEEMPPEAKMRMKNIGRDTPTSSGPNSFGKSRMGFCDSKKIYERKMKEIQDKLDE